MGGTFGCCKIGLATVERHSLRRAMNPVMNETKWDEIRLAMYRLGPLSPEWRTLDVKTGYLSQWDNEWFYHFRNGGYNTIEWLEVRISSTVQYDAVRDALGDVNVPGEQTGHGFKVFGYVPTGVAIDYLTQFKESLHPPPLASAERRP
jgi:hypothetical protein